MDIDRLLDFEKRTGIKNSDIDEFLAKANAVDEAIRGMREGTVDPDSIKIDGIDCDPPEVQAEKERKRQLRRAELEREAEELRIKRKEEERKKWWAGVDLFVRDGDVNKPDTPVDEISKAEVEKNVMKERYSMDYSRWNQWQPQDPATLKEIEEREEEEDRKRNEEFEKNNAEWCQQYLKDIEERDKATRKKKTSSKALKLKGNKHFKAKRFQEALECYMEGLALTPYDDIAVNLVTNIAQAHIKLEEYDDAMEFLDRAIALDPKNIKAHSRKAFVLSECMDGKLEESVEWAEKAYKLDKDHSNQEVTTQYYELKQALIDSRKEKEIEEKVLSKSSKSPASLDSEGNGEPQVEALRLFGSVMQGLASDKKEGSLDVSASTSMIDLLKPRLEALLEKCSADCDHDNDKNQKVLSNHDIFIDAIIELLEGDETARVYLRTSGSLQLLINFLAQQVVHIKEAKEDNRKPEYGLIGKHMIVLAVALVHERSSKLEVMKIEEFIGGVKFVCGLGDAPAHLLQGSLLVLLNGLDESCSKMRKSILNDKTLLLQIGSALCTVNTILAAAARGPQHSPQPSDLASFSSSQLLCCQLIRDIVFSNEVKPLLQPVTSPIVSILGSTLAAEESFPDASKHETLNCLLEALLGCSQHELLRAAFTHEVQNVSEEEDCEDTAIDVILEKCHEKEWMVSNGLSILMNLTIKELSGVDIRRIVYDAGATDLCLAILSEGSDQDSGSRYKFVRAVGLISRLSSLPEVQDTLRSTTVYQTICQRLIKNASIASSHDEPWVMDERNQLIRVVASVRDIPAHARDIGLSLKLPRALVGMLPMPRQELNKITPSSVILPPAEPMNALILGNIALSLLPYADDQAGLQAIFLGESIGVEKFVCAMATCSDMRVRKNIAILLAKGCRSPEVKKKVEHYRGLQMIVELQKQLL